MRQYWRILLPTPPYSELTYELPEWFPALQPGCRVLVSVRRSLRVGVAVGKEGGQPEFTTKPILWVLDKAPILDAPYLELVRELACRQMSDAGAILHQLLPAGLRSSDFVFAIDGAEFPSRLRPQAVARMTDSEVRRLLALWENGSMRLHLNPAREAEETVVRLMADPPWPVRPNAVQQLALLEYLLENGQTTRQRLNKELGSKVGPALRRLTTLGLVCTGRQEVGDDLGDQACVSAADVPVNSPEQNQALERLSKALRSDRAETALLHGVTGSGKTHVYLSLAEQCLASGRSVLLLAPEVALACGLFRAVQQRFPGKRCLLYHGYQSPGSRRDAFLSVASGEPTLVVGTRSALFLPIREPGLIVVDEEHDESFKQEERLAYQAKEIAWFRAKQAHGLLVLGSATPDVKSYYAASQGHLPLIPMTHRVGGGTPPDIRLVSIAGMKNADNPLAPETVEALRETVSNGGQAIVMLNRRGYAPLMYCLDCEEVIRCPHCQVAMTFHKSRERLVCHYCGTAYPYPMLCMKCGGGKFLPMGEGTERLEESLAKALPEGVGILRMDRDTTRRQERMEEILSAFSREEAQVLVGTQMLSKGHHFPKVTLVVVVDGDLGLNLPDYRSAERTYQLLLQVAGRAGRSTLPGRVLVQTRNPGHPFWQHVLGADYSTFYQREIEQRERFSYPPFVRLGLIRMSIPACNAEGEELPEDPNLLMKAGDALQGAARRCGVKALGPAPAPLAMLRGRRRYNCLLKAGQWPDIRSVFAAFSSWNPDPANIRMRLDLDPVNML